MPHLNSGVTQLMMRRKSFMFMFLSCCGWLGVCVSVPASTFFFCLFLLYEINRTGDVRSKKLLQWWRGLKNLFDISTQPLHALPPLPPLAITTISSISIKHRHHYHQGWNLLHVKTISMLLSEICLSIHFAEVSVCCSFILLFLGAVAMHTLISFNLN